MAIYRYGHIIVETGGRRRHVWTVTLAITYHSGLMNSCSVHGEFHLLKFDGIFVWTWDIYSTVKSVITFKVATAVTSSVLWHFTRWFNIAFHIKIYIFLLFRHIKGYLGTTIIYNLVLLTLLLPLATVYILNIIYAVFMFSFSWNFITWRIFMKINSLQSLGDNMRSEPTWDDPHLSYDPLHRLLCFFQTSF